LGGNGDGALGGLATAQDNLMSPDIPNRLDYGAQAGRDQLDRQHYSSRGMPSQMLGQTLSGLLTLGAPAYNASAAGMDQFYGANRFDERPYEQMRGDLNAGFGTVGQQIGGVQRGIESGYGTANQQVNDMWDRSLGQLPEFTSPTQRIQRERDAELLRRRFGDEDYASGQQTYSEYEDLASQRAEIIRMLRTQQMPPESAAAIQRRGRFLDKRLAALGTTLGYDQRDKWDHFRPLGTPPWQEFQGPMIIGASGHVLHRAR
jgi:hypothetical protein